jgi:hypothetical protein
LLVLVNMAVMLLFPFLLLTHNNHKTPSFSGLSNCSMGHLPAAICKFATTCPPWSRAVMSVNALQK